MIGALGLCATVVAPASAVVVHQPNGHFLGVAPRQGVSASSIPGSPAAGRASTALSDGGILDYHGGPVVHSSAPYLIFWTPSGESMPSGSETLLERYFTDVAADSGTSTNVFGVDRQFTDSAGFADYRQTYSSSSQAIVDTQPYPALDAANCKDPREPTCLTDAQLQEEVQRLIVADGLPDDGPASAGELTANAPIYFVVVPPDVNVCFGAGQPTVCSDNYFCAYHSSFKNANKADVLYAAIPTVLAVSDPKGCQADGNTGVQEPNGNVADVVISYMSHEDNETTTDPLGTAWWDSSSGNEEGDNCVFTGSFDPAQGTNPNAFTPTVGGSSGSDNLYDQLIGGNPYYTQSEWSNGDGNCEMQPSAGTISPGFTTPAGPNGVGASLNFDPTSSTSTNPISSATWGFGDGTTAFQLGSPTPVSHAYTSAGTYEVELTLVDNRGNVATSSQSIKVGYPAASFSVSPPSPVEGTAVSFDASGSSDPDAGVTIVSYSWNFGDGTTAIGQTSSHIYTQFGSYTVTLTVTNSLGLSTSSERQVTVTDELPTASFVVTSANPARGVPVRFDASASSDPDGTISSYVWSFGDGAGGSGATPRHTYSRKGTYTVTLTVTDSSGQSAAKSEQLRIVRGSRVTSISVSRTKQLQFLVIAVDGAGRLSVGKRTYVLRRARRLRIRLALTGAEQSRLARNHWLKVKIRIAFVPRIGAHTTRTVRLRLRD